MKQISYVLAAVLLVATGCAKKPEEKAQKAAAASGAVVQGDGACAPGLDIAPDTPVAKIGDEVITCAALYEKDKGAILQAQAEFAETAHRIHEHSLEQLINEKLIEAKAKEAGQTVEQYLEAQTGVEAPSEEEMKKLYDQAAASGQQLPPYDQVKPQIAEFLTGRQKQEKAQALQKSLREGAKVETMLPPYLPPKQEVEAVGPSKGPENAPVTIVEFSDFECPFCGRAEPTIAKVLETYGDKVRLVYRDYPLPMHPNAPKASEAALCAQDQGKYWDMHAKLFANQRALAVEQLKGYARELGLDQKKFDECLDSGKKGEIVAASMKAGEAVGVTGTPAFFINGRMLSGAQPFERFQAIIDHELAQQGVK